MAHLLLRNQMMISKLSPCYFYAIRPNRTLSMKLPEKYNLTQTLVARTLVKSLRLLSGKIRLPTEPSMQRISRLFVNYRFSTTTICILL